MSLLDQMNEDLKRAIGEMPVACKFGELEFDAGRSTVEAGTNNGQFGVTEDYKLSIRVPRSEFTGELPKIDDTIEIVGDKTYNVESTRIDTISIFLNLGKEYT